MSILTDSYYLDEIQLSGGSQADYDGTATTDWTDGDTGTGVSTSGITFDGKSCFKFDSGAAGAGNVAILSRDVGSFATPEWITIKTYFDTLGTLANSDYFSMVLNGTSYRLSVRFCSDGLYVYDGAVWNEVGVDLVSTDTWQEWTFNWTVAASGVVDIYLNNVLVGSAVDCSDSTAGTNGTTTFSQYGTTVQGLTYVDYIKIGTAKRYGGETFIMNEGAELTIRTDTRWHANSPASYLGSLGSQTVNNGKLIYDGTDIRWLAVDTASGDSPIGTTITQGAVSGYYLGFYTNLTSAPTTALGAATGFIKLREVTGGAFSAGALTFGSGTGAANASSADVTGWIEIVGDAASTVTVARLGEHRIRGDWFYLDNTNGSIGQQIQIPTNGGGSGTVCPGIWVETAESSGVYEYYPSLNAANGWTRQHLGAAYGEQDARQNFVKDLGGGLLQFGEASDLSCTYENTPAQASTYAEVVHASTYAVVSGVCTVTYATGHLLKTGASVGIDFVDGGASALDNIFTITVIDPYTYSFALATADTSGTCNVRPGLTVTFTAHTLAVGDTVYCDFTSGGGADGAYTIYARGASGTAANTYIIAYPSTSAVATGNVTVYSRYTIIYGGATASDYQSLVAGNRVYLDFTSGSGTDGLYTVVYPTAAATSQASTYSQSGTTVTVTFTAHGRKVGDYVYVDATSGTGVDGVYKILTVAANTFTYTAGTSLTTSGNCTVYPASFDVIANNGASADSGNVTVKQTIGNIPANNCRTRIPNVILREATTAARASNTINAAVASRPEWSTTTAGAIDFEYAYTTWYMNFAQAYSVALLNCSTYDAIVISECATALDVDNVHTSMNGAVSLIPLTLTSNFAGGTVQNCKFHRGWTPASSGHAVSVGYCIGTILTNVTGGIIQMNRTTGVAMNVSYGGSITVNNFRAMGGTLSTTAVNGITINDLDYVDRYIGYTNANTAYYAVQVGAGSVDVLVDGITLGYSGVVPNVHPYSGLVYSAAGSNVCFRNIGSKASPIPCGSWRPSLYAMGVACGSGGNNVTLRNQRIYIDNNMRTGTIATTNSDKGVTHQNVYGGDYVLSTMAVFGQVDAGLNSVMKGVRAGTNYVTGQSSVYGTHFLDIFSGDSFGRYVLACNEPTTETTSYFTMVAGTKKFTSAGGILMGVVNDQAVWEDQYFRKGHTGFVNATPTMSGGTIGNYTIEYDIDTGSGFSGSYTAATGANLSGETIDPAVGFRLKVRITTTTANSTAITFLRFETTTSAAAQANTYYLDEYTLTISGLETGTTVAFLETGTETLLDDVRVTTGSTASYIFPDTTVGDTVDVAILKAGYVYQKISYTLTAANATIPVVMETDLAYITADSDVTFDGATHRIVADAGVTDLNVQSGVYSAWIDWALTSDNIKYEQAIRAVGGDTISATKDLGLTYFLLNDWKIRPDEDDYKLTISGNIYTDPSGSSVTVPTLGAYNVTIELSVSNLIDLASVSDDVWSNGKALTVGKFIALK